MEWITLNPGKPDLIVVSTILGGRLWATDGTDGDALWRGNALADEFDATVLVHDRLNESDIAPRRRIHLLGLPKALDPSEFTLRSVERGQWLADRIASLDPERLITLDVSLGVTDRMAMLETGTHPTPDVMSLFDASAVRNVASGLPWPFPQAGLFGEWAVHQVFRELKRPDEARNQNPMEHLGKAPVGALADMAVNSRVLPTDSTAQSLKRIAERKLAVGSKIRMTVPGKTFTNPAQTGAAMSDWINVTSKANGVDFLTSFRPDLYHSYPDDPAVCVQLVKRALR